MKTSGAKILLRTDCRKYKHYIESDYFSNAPRTYFNDLHNVVDIFGPVSIADLFLKLNCENKEEWNYIYNDNKLYCYKNGIWIQSNDELRET